VRLVSSDIRIIETTGAPGAGVSYDPLPNIFSNIWDLDALHAHPTTNLPPAFLHIFPARESHIHAMASRLSFLGMRSGEGHI